MKKRTLLGMSVLSSVVMHGAILAVAPSISVLNPRGAPERIYTTFRVRIVDDTTPPVEPIDGGSEQSLVSRPGAVIDLLDRESQTLSPSDALLKSMVDIPQLADRIAGDALEREHNLDVESQFLAKVDGKIVEISESAARQDVQVSRRLVAPSSSRVVGEGEYPVLRGRTDGDDESSLVIPTMPVRPVTQPALPPEPEQPVPADAGEDPGAITDLLPELPIDKMLARTQVAREVRDETDFTVMDDLVDIGLEAYLPPDEELGYFRLRIYPREGEDIEPLPRNVTFIVDGSKSMKTKLDRMVSGLQEVIRELRPDDRFNVVVFRDTTTQFQPEPVPATNENKASAVAFLAAIESRGETDFYKAIRPVVLSEPQPGIPNVIIVITDGRPTTGMRDARTIINTLTSENDLKNSIFAYAGGRTVNRYMLDLLAYRNKGESFVSPQVESIEEELPGFFGKFDQPIVVDCRADYGRIDANSVFPRQIPDFYKGHAVTVYGRFDPRTQREFAMRLTGLAGREKKEVLFKADFSAAATGDEQIAHDWAFRKIYSLIGEICRVGERPELMEEVRVLSAKHGIRTSYDQ